MSEKVKLVQETQKDVQAGFLMFLPVYRNEFEVKTLEQRRANLVGWVYSPFRAKDFITSIFSNLDEIDIEMHDGILPVASSVLFVNNQKNLLNHPSVFNTTKILNINDKKWTVKIHSHPKFEAKLNLERAYFILGLGVSSSVMLSLLIWQLLTGHITAVQLAKKMNEAFVKSEDRFKTLFRNAPIGIAIVDSLTGQVYKANQKFADIVGISLQELQTINWMKITYPDDIQASLDNIALMKAGKMNGYVMEKRYIHSNGSIVWVNLTVAKMNLGEGGRLCHQSIIEDITQRKHAEMQLAAERYRFAEIIRGTNAGTWEWNVQTGETIFSERWANLIGYTLAEISPTTIDTWIKFAHPDDLKLSYALLEKHFNHESDYYECETRMLHKSGDWIWVIDRGCVSSWTDDGKPLLMMGTHQDITQRKMAEETIKNLAFYDPLTQLPNRRLLQERVKHGINVCRRTGKQLAVFMLDLDKFKPVNDSLGHATGDVLLQQVALRIKNCVREVDMVARLGGDEFVILMEDIDGYENVTRIAKSIIENLTQPFLLGNNHVVQIGASIGICLYSEQSNSMEQLLDNADTALYTAKNQGRGCLVLYESVYDTDGISIK